uniref:PDZ domain-containing protein n=1 Tax=Sinocyclocheilus rhinocerous TaxID=307959 RepID=A0A673HWJ5_9TELE
EGTVTDSNPHLATCCELLELILRKGLQQPVLSLAHRDYWHCFEQLLHHDTCGRLSSVSLAVQQTTACSKLMTSQGRGRFFIRLMLMRRTLGNVVKQLLHTNRVIEVSGHSQVMIENCLLQTINIIYFLRSGIALMLSVKNCSFLDESWLLPVCQIYEAVPCRELGMVLRYLDGRVFVLDLLQCSQAQVDMFVEPGDIIDEINGISLRNASNGQAGVVLSKLKGQPLSIHLIRWRGEDGSIYQPLVKHLRQLKQEKPSLQFGPKPASQQDRTAGQKRGQTQCVKDGRYSQ